MLEVWLLSNDTSKVKGQWHRLIFSGHLQIKEIDLVYRFESQVHQEKLETIIVWVATAHIFRLKFRTVSQRNKLAEKHLPSFGNVPIFGGGFPRTVSKRSRTMSLISCLIALLLRGRPIFGSPRVYVHNHHIFSIKKKSTDGSIQCANRIEIRDCASERMDDFSCVTSVSPIRVYLLKRLCSEREPTT